MKFIKLILILAIVLLGTNGIFAQNTDNIEKATLECIDGKLEKSGIDHSYLISSLDKLISFIKQDNNDSIFALNAEFDTIFTKSGFYKNSDLDYSVLIDCMESSPDFDSTLIDSNLSFYHLYELFNAVDNDTSLLYNTNPIILLQAYDQAVLKQDTTKDFYKVISLIYLSSVIHKDNINRHKETEQSKEITKLELEEAIEEEITIENDSIYISDKVYNYHSIEEKPEYPGGFDSLEQYVVEKVKATGISQHYTVFVGFVILKDGSISNAKIVRGSDDDMNNIAIDIVNSMPKWKAGKVEGKEVKVYFILPIKFERDK